MDQQRWLCRPLFYPRQSRRGDLAGLLLKRMPLVLATASPRTSMGIRASNTATVSLEGVYVDADRLNRRAGRAGAYSGAACVRIYALDVAAFGLGGGWRRVDRQSRIRDAHPGGAPSFRKQGYTHKLIVPYVVLLERAVHTSKDG